MAYSGGKALLTSECQWECELRMWTSEWRLSDWKGPDMQRSGGKGPKEGKTVACSRSIRWQKHRQWGIKKGEVREKGRVISCGT